MLTKGEAKLLESMRENLTHWCTNMVSYLDLQIESNRYQGLLEKDPSNTVYRHELQTTEAKIATLWEIMPDHQKIYNKGCNILERNDQERKFETPRMFANGWDGIGIKALTEDINKKAEEFNQTYRSN